MTRAFIYSLIALGLGAWLYIMLGDDPGYVLISFGNWSVESTLVALVLFLLVLLVLVFGLYKLATLLNPFGLLRGDSWFGASRRRKAAAAASEEGMRLLLGVTGRMPINYWLRMRAEWTILSSITLPQAWLPGNAKMMFHGSIAWSRLLAKHAHRTLESSLCKPCWNIVQEK